MRARLARREQRPLDPREVDELQVQERRPLFQTTASFVTEDGAFLEQIPGILRRETSGDRFTGAVPLEALAGSYDSRWR